MPFVTRWVSRFGRKKIPIETEAGISGIGG